MRIAIASMDSRGGVQPYVALALGLRAAGHDVRLIAPADFAGMLADAGVEHAPLSGDVEADAQAPRVSAAHGSPLAGMRAAAREMEHWTAIHTREAYEACRWPGPRARRHRRHGGRPVGGGEGGRPVHGGAPPAGRRARRTGTRGPCSGRRRASSAARAGGSRTG